MMVEQTTTYFTQDEFDKKHGYKRREPKCIILQAVKNSLQCSLLCAINIITGFLPILKWLPKYKPRTDLLPDFIAGITVGIMHIPQGMAYAELAGVRPQYGLYTSFWPSLIYAFLGTSRHVSLGVFAVVSLMVGQVRFRYVPISPSHPDFNLTTTDKGPLDGEYYPIEVVTALAFAVGILQIAMGLLRLGFITNYMSDQVIAGFTTGAAVHVFTAQLNKVLNVKLPRHSGIGQSFRAWYELACHIPDANWVTLVGAALTIVFIFVGKEYINPPFKRKFKIPIPWDLIAVVIGTIISTVLGLHESHGVKIVGDIPQGFPPPHLPPLELVPRLIPDAFGIAIIAYVVTVSLGKLFAKKHHYRIDPAQEWYAVGIVELICSVTHCWPASTALARSLVFESAGAQSLLANFFTCGLLASVILFAGPLFKELPMVILAGIIIVSLKGMFMQFKQLPELWRVSRIDLCVWLVSFLATVCLDVRFGLLVSILFAMFTSILRSQRPETHRLAKMKDCCDYVDIARYSDVDPNAMNDVRIVRFNGALQFTNIERFRSDVYEVSSIDIYRAQESLAKYDRDLKSNKRRAETQGDIANISLNLLAKDAQNGNIKLGHEALKDLNLPSYLVLDLGAVNFVDYMGVNVIIDLNKELADAYVTLLIADVPARVRDTLDRCENFADNFSHERMFPSVHDAVQYALVHLNVPTIIKQ